MFQDRCITSQYITGMKYNLLLHNYLQMYAPGRFAAP